MHRMFETLRDAASWCRAGAAIGTVSGLTLAVSQNSGMWGYAVAAFGFGLLGIAAGFGAATFFYGVRKRGLRRTAKAALNSAAASIVLVPVFRLLGWSGSQSLIAEFASAIVFLALVGAYFEAAEIWMPKKTGGTSL